MGSKVAEVKWVSSLSVGEKTIDSQHQKLFNQIQVMNSLLQSSDLNMGVLRDAIHFLYVYIQEHFSYEEQYMEKHHYPGLENHKQIHMTFVAFYDDFQKELRDKLNKKDFSSIELKELLTKIKIHLSDWLTHHIKVEDHKYSVWIKAHSKKK